MITARVTMAPHMLASANRTGRSARLHHGTSACADGFKGVGTSIWVSRAVRPELTSGKPVRARRCRVAPASLEGRVRPEPVGRGTTAASCPSAGRLDRGLAARPCRFAGGRHARAVASSTAQSQGRRLGAAPGSGAPVRTRCWLGSRRPRRCGPLRPATAVGGPRVRKTSTAASAVALPLVNLRRCLRVGIVTAPNPHLDEIVDVACLGSPRQEPPRLLRLWRTLPNWHKQANVPLSLTMATAVHGPPPQDTPSSASCSKVKAAAFRSTSAKNPPACHGGVPPCPARRPAHRETARRCCAREGRTAPPRRWPVPPLRPPCRASRPACRARRGRCRQASPPAAA
jgi:hypothetical protein